MSAGALSRIWAVTLVSPLELIRTKMQSQKMAFYQVRQALAITIESQGVLGLWRGYSATLLRDVPFSAIYWPCYEFLRPKNYNFFETFLAGAAAGTAACTLTLPMDVIKTRFQIELGEKMITSTPNGSTMTNLSVAKEILAREGVKGLFTGLVPRILKVAPACAIMIASYEYCKRIFSEKNAELRLHQKD
jgi:solute carrier family 25 protein 39/40